MSTITSTTTPTLSPNVLGTVVPNVASSESSTLGNVSTSTDAAASPEADLPNPRLTVAPGTNRVVLQFFDSSGTLTNSIPSQQQLDAYRLAAAAGEPVGGGSSDA